MTYLPTWPVLVSCCVGVLLALMLLGCEEDVPLAENIAYPYEIYGIIDPSADTQWVRVFPINYKLQANPHKSLDAEVTSIDRVTDETTTWRDSIVSYGGGDFGYLYWTAAPLAGGRPHRIQVTRADGAQAEADVVVPGLPELMEPHVFPSVTLPINYGPAPVIVRDLTVTYRIRYGRRANEEVSVIVSHVEQPVHLGSGGLVMDVPLEEDAIKIQKMLIRESLYRYSYGMLMRYMRIHTTVTDAGWAPPNGVFDPEVLIEPGTMSNVGGAFGFVGSGYMWDTTLYAYSLTDEVLAAAGYRLEDPEDGR